MARRPFVLLLGVLTSGPAYAAWPDAPIAADWRTQESTPIRVECATVEGLPWCRSSAILPASVAALKGIVTDFDAYPKIFAHIGEVRALEANVRYLRLDYPSPLQDRDYSAAFSVEESAAGYRIWWRAVEHLAAPPLPGVVRLARAAGQWELRPVAGGTWVVYTWEADMSGDIAEWMQGRARAITGVEVLGGLARAANAEPTAPPAGP